MAFFDEMKNRVTQASQSAAKSAKEFSEITRLNGEISDAESRINQLYNQIGYEVYCAYSAHPLPEAADLIEQVNALHDKIENCPDADPDHQRSQPLPQLRRKDPPGHGLLFRLRCTAGPGRACPARRTGFLPELRRAAGPGCSLLHQLRHTGGAARGSHPGSRSRPGSSGTVGGICPGTLVPAARPARAAAGPAACPAGSPADLGLPQLR